MLIKVLLMKLINLIKSLDHMETYTVHVEFVKFLILSTLFKETYKVKEPKL